MAYQSNITNWRGYWQWVNVQTVTRPDRTLPQSQKGEAYDAACARCCLGNQQATQVNSFRLSYEENAAYATGLKWGTDEDIKLFLGDSSASTSRVSFRFPIIQPMLTRMRGMADNLSVTPLAIASTQFAKTRREDELLLATLMSRAAQAGPDMAAAYAEMGVSPDEQYTVWSKGESYQDKLVPAITALMTSIANENAIDDRKKDIAQSLALSGLSAMHASVQGAKLVWDLCDPNEVGWDPSSIRPDFSDGEYVFVCPLMSVSTIAEKWQPKREAIVQLDKWANITTGNTINSGWPQARPRVFTVYWKDCDYVERGYVEENGELVLVTVNQPDPDSKTGTPKYTDADLKTPPENKYTVLWSDLEWSQKKQKRYVEEIRYCSFIPWEYLPGAFTDNKTYDKRQDATAMRSGIVGPSGDLILERGVYQLQEADPDDTYERGFPVKFSTWTYIAGNVVAPLTAAISPQRVMNQITSDLMWRLRKSGNKSVSIDTDALNGSTMSEEAILLALKEGDPVNLKGAIVGGLQNAVRELDTSPGNSFYQMFALLPQMKGVAESSVGVYESNFGAPQGQDQLVGTLQLQLQQAGVMQQPFNAAIAMQIKQVHQFDAQAGKQHYARYPWVLSQMVGDDNMEALLSSKDMQNEQFRIEVTMTSDIEQRRMITDTQTIPMLLQMGMLDPTTAAKILGRATPYEAYRAAEKFTREAQQVASQQAAAQEQAMAQQAVAMEQAAIRDEEADIAKQETDASLKMAQIQQKKEAPFLQAESEWSKPDAMMPQTGATP